jgi:hypothetical protein
MLLRPFLVGWLNLATDRFEANTRDKQPDSCRPPTIGPKIGLSRIPIRSLDWASKGKSVYNSRAT